MMGWTITICTGHWLSSGQQRMNYQHFSSNITRHFTFEPLKTHTHTHKWYQKLTIFASVNQYTDDRNSYTDDRNGYLNDLNQYTDDKNGYLNDPRSTILHSPQWECPVCPPLAASQTFQLAHGRNINAQKILGQLVWPFFSQWLSWGPLKFPC